MGKIGIFCFGWEIMRVDVGLFWNQSAKNLSTLAHLSIKSNESFIYLTYLMTFLFVPLNFISYQLYSLDYIFYIYKENYIFA